MMHTVELKEYQQFGLELVHAAREITRHYFRSPVPQELKSDESPVTLADQETERVIREMIREYYPQHGIQGEEWGIENPEAEWRWVIDPIDGTKAFLAGMPTFVTLIALCHKGIPVLGIIDQPITSETWVGMQGEATLFNGQPISRVQDTPADLTLAMIGTTDPALFPDAARERYADLRNQCAMQICGGDGYIYGRLCSGIPHLVCEHGLKPHDFAALRPVIEGAGGVITDWNGHPLTLDSAGDVIAATSPTLHQLALSALSPS
jgi:inositol-phosphate phosphatase / L-galactose 1-phosphate phosphatase / histidinol-phosphatase